MSIIVTGASGHFGRLAIEGLLREVDASDLILVTRNVEKLAKFAARGCTVRSGDFDAPEDLAEAFGGGDRMLLISGTRVGKRVDQHGAAIAAAEKAGVRKIVYTSFIGADDPDNQAEAVSDHRGTEAVLRMSGLEWTMLRDAQYADAVTDVMAHSMVMSGTMLSVAGDGRMAFVWREDCAASAVAVLVGDGHAGRAYDITGPELVSYREVAALIEEFTVTPLRFQLTNEAGLYAMFDSIGIPREPVDHLVVEGNPWNSNDMVSFEVAVRDGLFAVVSDDVERLTGKPARTLRALFEAKADMLAQIGAARRDLTQHQDQ